MPVLDGMTLAHLEKTPGMNPADYGKERLYGAISWAIVNLAIGPIVDIFGFVALYPIAMVVTVVFFLCIATYVHGQEKEASSLRPELVSQQEDFTFTSIQRQQHDEMMTIRVKIIA